MQIEWNPIWNHGSTYSNIFIDKLWACKKCHRIVAFVHKDNNNLYMMPFRLIDDRPHGKHCFPKWNDSVNDIYKFNYIL